MELTDNDKQRIEQEIDKGLIARGEHPTRVRNPLYGEERELAMRIAEYATLYERQQKEKQSWDKMKPIQELIKLDPATRAFYEYIRSGWDIVTLFVEMTKYYRGIPENSLGNTFPNAERAELRNKVIEEVVENAQYLIKVFREVDVKLFPTMVIRAEALEDFINSLNSLKTK